MPGKGAILGKTLMPRDIADAAHAFWQNYELTKAVATALAESTGALGAYHDNFSDEAMTHLLSRDCGLYQINILASAVGTAREFSLRTESQEELDWLPVLKANTAAASKLYNAPWTNGRRRLWEPWVSYTTGWATFPEWWVWHQNAAGEPVGPWLPTGRYIHKAIAGQMNMHVVIKKDWTPEIALSYSKRYLEHFGVEQGKLYVNKVGILVWEVPPKPTRPPADGIGPRPVPNVGT